VDWKYNNKYVDGTDLWRHSKWVSFMHKRLRFAKRLLKRDGVLVVTVDEHEIHHLGLLLERKDLFASHNRQLVTIVNNPKGVTQLGLSRVEEYALFCYPDGVVMHGRGEGLLTHGKDLEEEEVPIAAGKAPRWQGLLHSGEGHRRQERRTVFYPVLIDEEKRAVLGTGEQLRPEANPDGTLPPVETWPEPDWLPRWTATQPFGPFVRMARGAGGT
jgi:adenine-specific DNA-methyltransferase